jgi:hypothetical protein
MACASVLISIAALIIALYALREARKSNTLPGALEFLGQYRGLATDRRRVIDKLKPNAGEVSDLDPEIRDEVIRVSHYLDQLGFLVEHNLVDAKLVAGFMGDSIVLLWQVLSPFIKTERERRGGGDYQWYFQKLAERMEAMEPARVRRERGWLKRFGS